MKKETGNRWTDLMAAAAFAEAGEPETALEILEEGKGAKGPKKASEEVTIGVVFSLKR
ncbi:hypothetical protein [Thermosulfuriphilus sp.]